MKELFAPIKQLPKSVFVIAGVLCVLAGAVTLVVFSLLTSDDSNEPFDYTDIVVNGDFGAPVIISMPKHFQQPESMESLVLIEGDGDEIGAEDTVLLRTSSFDSRTGKIISEYGEGTLHVVHANDEGLDVFAPLVIGQKQGTRLMIVRPDDTGKTSASEIIVMDILYTSVRGEPIAASEYAKDDSIAKVSLSEQGVPQIHASGKRINKLSIIPLITGSGGQVEAENNIAIQYVITDAGGNIIENTWDSGAPALVNLDGLMEGLQAGLENQKVGSRVLVMIPSAMAQGDGDRIAVVDILAAGVSEKQD